jgi:multidrug efflux pump subunit AcrB
MARTVSVTANLHGASLGKVAQKVEGALKQIETPVGVSVAVRGQVQPLRELEAGLKNGLGVAVLVIMLVLMANFQSIRLPLVVLSAVPAVLTGVVAALWVTGETLNLQSFMGAVMAIGVSVSNAILFVTFAERAQRAGLDRKQAALEGLSGRVRPILMTSVAMMAGIVPMAFGGTVSGPLGKAVLGGLAVATLSTLFILPAVYALLARSSAASASLDPDDAECTLPAHAGRRVEPALAVT